MANSVVLETESRWVLARCPGTGDEVVGSGWDKQFVTTEGEVTWWRCPSCEGWHVMQFDHQGKSQKCSVISQYL